MPLALETIIGYVDGLTGTPTYDALTPNTNQSFTVRAYQAGSWAWLEDIWLSFKAHPGFISIKSPRMHDDVLGVQLVANPLGKTSGTADFNPQTVLPGYLTNRLYSTDTLSVTATGTAADDMVGVFNVRYENLGGVSARLFHWNEIQPLIANLVGIEVDCTGNAQGGLLGPGQALNSTTSRFKANVDYAWLGYTTDTAVTAVVMNGVDLGNLNVGGPGAFDEDEIGDFFVDASVQYNTAHIPVINSLNVGGTFVSVADVIDSQTCKVTLLMGELSQRLGSPTAP